MDGNPETAGEPENPGDMVTVLMRDQHAVYLFRRDTETSQFFNRCAGGEATVQQEPGVTGIDNQAITLTAAAE